MNPLILNTIHLPTYDIPLQYINQHLHTYNTNKIWHNTYLYGNPNQIIEFKNSQYQQLDYQYSGILFAKFDKTHQLVVRIDNGVDVSIMPYKVYKHSKFLHYLPLEDHISMINTGNGSIKTYKFIHILLEIQNIGIQLRLLVCNSTAYTDILLGHDAMLALGMWQDYPQEKLYIKQTAIPFRAIPFNKQISILPGKKTTFPITLALTPDSYQLKYNIIGHIPIQITPKATHLPYTLVFPEVLDSQIIMMITN